MAITIESSVFSEEELAEALSSIGAVPEEQAKPKEEPAKEADKEKPSESTGELGGSAEATEGKSGTESEPVKKEKQEAPQGESNEEKNNKRGGGWQRQVEKKTAQIEALNERLDEEVGDKRRLREERDALKAELEQLKAGKPSGEPTKETGPVRPKRPAMPQLSEFEFDADKFGKAMKEYQTAADKYDDDMTAYYEQVADKKAKEAVAAENQRQVEAQQEYERVQKWNVSVDRLNESKKHYEDFEEVYSRITDAMNALPKDERSMPIDSSTRVLRYLQDVCKDRAGVLRHLYLDYLDNDSADQERILALDPDEQIIELKEIEKRLASEREAKAKPAAKAPEPPPPAPKKPAKTPEPPIEPVSPRPTTVDPGNLNAQLERAAEAGDFREIRRLRELQRQQVAKQNGRA